MKKLKMEFKSIFDQIILNYDEFQNILDTDSTRYNKIPNIKDQLISYMQNITNLESSHYIHDLTILIMPIFVQLILEARGDTIEEFVALITDEFFSDTPKPLFIIGLLFYITYKDDVTINILEGNTTKSYQYFSPKKDLNSESIVINYNKKNNTYCYNSLKFNFFGLSDIVSDERFDTNPFNHYKKI